MPKFKYLLQREGVWYYRRPVPSDIREDYGKQVISTSLHTNDFDEAKRLAHKENVKYDEEFDRYRTDDSDELVEKTLDNISIKQACDARFKKIIKDDFEYRAVRTPVQ